eukprot:COSAG05_NODE_209_length_14039_cov_138.574892_1_plen_287_part_10
MLATVMATVLLGVANAQITMRASGTTNPKKLHWELMEKMESMAGQSLDLTYRGVGSSTGKVDFLNETTAFGCSEVPVTSTEQTTLAKTVLHLPLVMGAMSVFHSIPAAHTGTAGLRLTPCMLAKIFSRTITMWNDPLLRDGGSGTVVNAALVDVNQSITVYRRTKGSSTTNFFTKYLDMSTTTDCPGDWTAGSGATITWAAGTTPVQGSGGMSAGISSNPYSIGYIDSGHGHNDGLSEVLLKNLDGTYLDSTTAGTAGIQAAVTGAGQPPTAEANGAWTSYSDNLIN